MSLLGQHVAEFSDKQQRLRQQLERAKEQWSDSVSKEFAEKTMRPLFEQVQRTQREMEELLHLFEQVDINLHGQK